MKAVRIVIGSKMAHRGIERLCVVVVELSFETWQAYLAFLAGRGGMFAFW